MEFIILGLVAWFIFTPTKQEQSAEPIKMKVPQPPVLTDAGMMDDEDADKCYRKQLADIKNGTCVPPEVVAREQRLAKYR